MAVNRPCARGLCSSSAIAGPPARRPSTAAARSQRPDPEDARSMDRCLPGYCCGPLASASLMGFARTAGGVGRPSKRR
eukprot:14143315-Alexandrium_andersonii.AAC.1